MIEYTDVLLNSNLHDWPDPGYFCGQTTMATHSSMARPPASRVTVPLARGHGRAASKVRPLHKIHATVTG
jgi:hypothetical protein